jgi:hypothetical protein
MQVHLTEVIRPHYFSFYNLTIFAVSGVKLLDLKKAVNIVADPH